LIRVTLTPQSTWLLGLKKTLAELVPEALDATQVLSLQLVIGTRITALDSFAQGQAELSVRRLEQRMVECISRDGDWRSALFDSARSLLLPLNATGAALLFEGQILATGDVPATEHIRDIGRWLEPKIAEGVFATASLSAEDASFAPLTGVASGVVATRICGEASDMLIWFRNERVRTVTWGGNPFQKVAVPSDPAELSPNRPFAQWHQVVEGASDPWTPADLTAARLIGASVTDVIVQFRSVRILIAQDQLEQVRRQVRASDQHVVVANAQGEILEANPAFAALLGRRDKAGASLGSGQSVKMCTCACGTVRFVVPAYYFHGEIA
jgi:light-regulated signal transduction histidine kinase (bacteriophytochrome)